MHSADPIESHLQFKTNRIGIYCGALVANRSTISKWNLTNPILVIQLSFIFLLISLISFNSFFFSELCS